MARERNSTTLTHLGAFNNKAIVHLDLRCPLRLLMLFVSVDYPTFDFVFLRLSELDRRSVPCGVKNRLFSTRSQIAAWSHARSVFDGAGKKTKVSLKWFSAKSHLILNLLTPTKQSITETFHNWCITACIRSADAWMHSNVSFCAVSFVCFLRQMTTIQYSHLEAVQKMERTCYHMFKLKRSRFRDTIKIYSPPLRLRGDCGTVVEETL